MTSAKGVSYVCKRLLASRQRWPVVCSQEFIASSRSLSEVSLSRGLVIHFRRSARTKSGSLSAPAASLAPLPLQRTDKWSGPYS